MHIFLHTYMILLPTISYTCKMMHVLLFPLLSSVPSRLQSGGRLHALLWRRSPDTGSLAAGWSGPPPALPRPHRHRAEPTYSSTQPPSTQHHSGQYIHRNFSHPSTGPLQHCVSRSKTMGSGQRQQPAGKRHSSRHRPGSE